jgi:hypothetical protein
MESTLGLSLHDGQRVMTRDDHELGTVKEVVGDSFKVDAPMKRDYWLSFGSVLSIEGERVVMDFDEEVLESYQLDGPDEGVVSESPILDAEAETFTSIADKDLRRERNIHPDRAGDV